MELNEKTINTCLDGWKAVYDMLEDEESKDIYLNRLNWLISKNAKYIQNIVTSYLPQLNEILMRKIFDLKESLPKDKPIILYGAGFDGRMMLPCFAKDSRFIGFCSKTKAKQENGYCGYPVISPDELLSRKDASVVISSSKYKEELLEALNRRRIPGFWRLLSVGKFLGGRSRTIFWPRFYGIRR